MAQDYKKATEVTHRAMKYLDTHDKRWMFLKIFFPTIGSHCKLEGSPMHTCFDIVQQMQRRDQLDKFEQHLIEVFEN